MQARWFVWGALLAGSFRSTSVAEAQPSATAPVMAPQHPGASPAAPTAPVDNPALPSGSAASLGGAELIDSHTEDYRIQLVVADIGSAFAVAIAKDKGELLALGNYLVAPLIIHTAHGEGARAFASAGLRIGLPLLGGLIGTLKRGPDNCIYDDFGDLSSGPDGSGCSADDRAMIIGMGIGALVAIAIDDGFLGRAHRIEQPAPGWAPRISIAPDRERALGSVSLGVAGQF